MHAPHLLRVANVCHPDVDGRERRNVMWAVAAEQGLSGWERRLREQKSVGPMLAMRMLSVLERRSPPIESWAPETQEPDRCLSLVLAVTGLILLLWWLETRKK